MCTLYYHSEDYETVATDAKPELTKRTIQNNQMLRASSKRDNLQIAGLQSEAN